MFAQVGLEDNDKQHMTALWFDLFGIISSFDMIFYCVIFHLVCASCPDCFLSKREATVYQLAVAGDDAPVEAELNIHNTPNTAVSSADIRRLCAIRLELS